METYRSGHNGHDSKSWCPLRDEGSNPSVSAIWRHHWNPNPQSSNDNGVFLFFHLFKRLLEVAFLIFISDYKIEKLKIGKQFKSKDYFRTPRVRLLIIRISEYCWIFTFFLFVSFVLNLGVRAVCVIEIHIIIKGLE